MSTITEVAAFEFISRTGERRVRVIIPAHRLGSETQPAWDMPGSLPSGILELTTATTTCAEFPSVAGAAVPWAPIPTDFGGLLMNADNPWFVLAFPRCGPPGATTCGTAPPAIPAFNPFGPVPPGTYAFTLPPYQLGTAYPPTPNPNPDNPSPRPYHANVLRHWANVTQDNPVQIIIACNVPSALATQDIFLGSNPVGPYPWQTWATDIQSTFATYTGCATAEVWVSPTIAFTDTSPLGYSAAGAYTVYDPPPPPGFSEIALPAPVAATPGIGLGTGGQLVWDYSATPAEPNRNGPTGNGFNEIVFLRNRRVMFGGFCSMDIDPATGAILECDVVFDTKSFTGGQPLQGLPSETTALRHEIGHFFGLDHTNLQPGSSNYPGLPSWMSFTAPIVPSEFSGMTGSIMRFAGTNMVAQPLHPDDANGIPRIYPVQVPSSTTSKDPLINTTATIRGRLMTTSNIDPALGRFGDNVFVLPRGFGLNWPGSPPDAPFVRAGTVSGTARLSPGDVVGALNTATSQPCSGGFEIIGVPASPPTGSSPYGTQYDVIAEDPGYTLSGVSTPSYGEWYQEAHLNPATNGIALVNNQSRFISNDGVWIGGGGGPSLPGQVPSWAISPVVGSFTVVQGTVIDVGIVAHGGGPNAWMPDSTSRPLLYVAPRKRPPSGGYITLMSASNYPLSLGSVSLTVNGIPFTNWTAPGVSIVTTPPTVTAVIPANLLLTPGVPARLVFTARETFQSGATGIYFTTGRNEVQY